MKITFLGTSAANAFPEPFCSCANCQSARQEGGKSLRKRSSILVNEDLLIDLGPDILSAANSHAIDLTGVTHCLQTHPHSDHLDLSHLLSRSPGFGTIGTPLLTLHGSAKTLARASETFKRDLSHLSLFDRVVEEELRVILDEIDPYRPVMIGPYRVTPFKANHAHRFDALLYVIEQDGHALFYGTDTGTLYDETWEQLRAGDYLFDIVILDHTYGPNERGDDHLCAQEVAAYTQQFREEGLLKETGQVWATHIAHEGNPAHSELDEYAQARGYRIAYDGLIIEC